VVCMCRLDPVEIWDAKLCRAILSWPRRSLSAGRNGEHAHRFRRESARKHQAGYTEERREGKREPPQVLPPGPEQSTRATAAALHACGNEPGCPSHACGRCNETLSSPSATVEQLSANHGIARVVDCVATPPAHSGWGVSCSLHAAGAGNRRSAGVASPNRQQGEGRHSERRIARPRPRHPQWRDGRRTGRTVTRQRAATPVRDVSRRYRIRRRFQRWSRRPAAASAAAGPSAAAAERA